MDPDHIAPPPAYSEQEFDQKVSQATALSILTPTPTFDEEGWQRYDPTAFTRPPVSPSGSETPIENRNGPANPSTPSYAKGGGMQQHQLALPTTQYPDKSKPINNLPAIVPLRIEKRSQAQYGKPYADQAYPESKGSFASDPNRTSNVGSSGTFSNGYYSRNNSQRFQESPSRLDHVPSPTPPSSFGRIASLTAAPPVVPPIYQRGGDEQTYDPYRDYQGPPPQTYTSSRQSLPVIPQVTSQRATHTHTRSRSETHNPPSVPRLQFDPAVAYGKPTSTPVTAIQAIHANIPVSPVSSLQYDPHSLYHSTVSSKMVPMRPSQGDIYRQGNTHEPTHNQGQNMGYPTRTGQQPQFVNDPGGNALQLNVDNFRQIPWQSPSRPMSTYPTTTSTPQPSTTPDPDRFSQYSPNSTRDSVYSSENNWYSPR